MDILVLAIANTLNLKIKILRKSPQDLIQVLIIECQDQQMEVILKIHTYLDPNNPNYVGANHYDSITKRSAPVDRLHRNEGEHSTLDQESAVYDTNDIHPPETSEKDSTNRYILEPGYT